MNESVRSGPDDQAGAGTEPEKEEEAAITEAEVLACQDGWAKAIQVGGWVGGWLSLRGEVQMWRRSFHSQEYAKKLEVGRSTAKCSGQVGA